MHVWKQIQFCFPVWYIDATGSVHNDILKQNSPYLYSIVQHDKTNKCILPLAEFVLTHHDIINISRNLLLIKESLLCYSNAIIAPIIVTDFSWALVNSVLKVFNNCTMLQYLNWAYDVCKAPERTESVLGFEMVCNLYLCSTHFLKSFINKVKPFKLNRHQRRTIVYSFSLLQNCTTLSEFDYIFINVFNIYNNEFLNEKCRDSLTSVKKECFQREIYKTQNIDGIDDPDSIEAAKDKILIKSDNVVFEFEAERLVLCTNSPFSNRFNQILNTCISLLPTKNINNNKNNPYYNPKLFQLIVDQLYIMPLWTGVMIKRCQLKYRYCEQFTRLTNNPVENWFKILKHNILLKKKVAPSELSIAIYKYVNSKVNKHYQNILIKKKNKENELTSNNKTIIEKWKSKKKEIPRQKGVYFTNVSNIGLIEGEQNVLFSKDDFEEAFEIYEVLPTEVKISQILKGSELIVFNTGTISIYLIF